MRGVRGASQAFEILQSARMTESANVDLTGTFGRAGLCVSFEGDTDIERSHDLMSILAPAFAAGVRTAACEQTLVSDPRLTARERQIAALLIARRRNREIARALGISEHTVRHHVESVCSKLGVHSRDEIAALVRRDEH
jgi:DNA-binding CsgD family transcriptional regulator